MKRKKLFFGEEGLWQKWKDHRLVRTVLFLLLGIILYTLLLDNVIPETVDVSIGTSAEQDVISPTNMIDEQATAELKEEAINEVDPVYVQDNSITNRQIDELNRFFQHVQDTLEDEDLSREEQLENIETESPFDLDEEHYETLVQYSHEDIQTMQAVTSDIVARILFEGVRERGDELQQAQDEVADSLIFSTLDADLQDISREMAKQSIVPNDFFDQEETQALQDEAADQVEPVQIREGEVLVEEGDVITRDAYEQLHELGLLSDSNNNWYPFVGLALFIFLILAFIGVYISTTDLPIQKNNTQFLIFVIIFALNVLVMKVVSMAQLLDLSGLGFVAPVAMGTMLMTMLLHQRLAILSSFLFGMIAAVVFNGEVSGYYDFQYALVAMFSSATGAFFLGSATRKSKILQGGFVVSAVTIIAVLAVLFIRSAPLTLMEWTQFLLFAFLNGILASVLTMGLMPFFEAAFGILSSIKLIELSSPNQPLLRKILVDSPGTYHHSVMVANLAEAATEAVGGNGLLARVGAYYHDIGKTKRPHFFIENQMGGENPHDKIAPHLSATILINHVKDGTKMLKEEKMPKAIVEIAEQHHGTSLIKYFYRKAQEESDGEVNENDFRYPGPKAQFKESAIVGIADMIEAAVRSLSKSSPERIEHIVRSLIRERLEEGEFNECDLTLKELDTIAKSMCETLKGTFHSRIEYPEEVKKEKDQKEAKKQKDQKKNQQNQQNQQKQQKQQKQHQKQHQNQHQNQNKDQHKLQQDQPQDQSKDQNQTLKVDQSESNRPISR